MATIIPELSDEQLATLPSRAESKIYKSFRNHLPDACLVLFRVGWILKREGANAADGETDFIVCKPDAGYICIEVKGGGIEFQSGTRAWFSVDRDLVRHPIKDPYEQAKGARYSIQAKLDEFKEWTDLNLRNFVRGHAVFFPDLSAVRTLAGPAMPESLIGCAPDLDDPTADRICLSILEKPGTRCIPFRSEGLRFSERFLHVRSLPDHLYLPS